MIGHPAAEDLPQLATLWREAFGDTEEETAFYFRHRHRNGNMLVFRAEGQVAGMLTMLPLALLADGKTMKTRYVFAVATKKAFRNHGISTRLLEAANSFASGEGCAATLLVPAGERLFEYYGKRGYQTAFFAGFLLFDRAELTDVTVSGDAVPCGVRAWSRMRDAAFGDSALYARWDEDALKYIKRSVEAGGGGVLRLRGKSGEAAAVCERRGDTLRVSELAGGMDAREAAALALEAFPAARCELRLRQGEARDARTIPFGMIRWLGPPPETGGGPNYLALAKD